MLQSPRHADPSRVLVVDDDRDTAETLACLLRLFGHDVSTALDGQRAIEIARRERPSCVLLDVGLPGLDGYEVAARLRRERAGSIVLIAVTGYGREEDRRAALAAGFDHHFVKPLDQDGFNALLAALDAGTWGGRGVGGDPPISDVPPPEANGCEECPPPTVRRQVEVTDPLGLHLRPVTRIAQLAGRFRAEARVGCDGRTASARSVLELMTLGASRGSRLELEADGPEAEAAVAALSELVGHGIDEPGGDRRPEADRTAPHPPYARAAGDPGSPIDASSSR
jgi:phosphotransferase system HPr (HPr) family protein